LKTAESLIGQERRQDCPEGGGNAIGPIQDFRNKVLRKTKKKLSLNLIQLQLNTQFIFNEINYY